MKSHLSSVGFSDGRADERDADLLNLSQSQLLSMLTSSFLCGLALGLVYEPIRLIRFVFLPKGEKGFCAVAFKILVSVTDAVYILLFALCGILLTQELCFGKFRGLIYVGMALAALLYYLSVARLTKKLSFLLARFIRRALIWILFVTSFPFRAIFLFLFRLYTLTIGKKIGKIIDRKRKKKENGLSKSDVPAASPAVLPCPRILMQKR